MKNGHAGAAELLLKGKANPNSADEQGHVAINDAVAKDRFDLVTKLLEFGALVPWWHCPVLVLVREWTFLIVGIRSKIVMKLN